MSQNILAQMRGGLEARAATGGGFAGQPQGAYRPDATAWAAIAYRIADESPRLTDPLLDRLAQSQFEDGRVPIAPGYPQAFWPTAESIMAWHGSGAHRKAQQRAGEFLLRTTGKHYKRTKKIAEVMGHDPSIKGWPWIESTHSWVEPTSMNLMALELMGQSKHPRGEEARRMLINRQLESGGWNYGNTKTFCLELRPSMESTGLALHALAGHIDQADVQHSIDYLERELPTTRTPLWLGWTVLGLSAWGRRPPDVEQAISESLLRQADYGSYDTAWISVLLLAASCGQGLVEQLQSLANAAEIA